MRRAPLASLRRQIGIVQQDVFLFDGSVRDNIAYGRPGASEEEVIRADDGGRWVAFAMLDSPVAALQQSYLRTKARALAGFQKVAAYRDTAGTVTLRRKQLYRRRHPDQRGPSGPESWRERRSLTSVMASRPFAGSIHGITPTG